MHVSLPVFHGISTKLKNKKTHSNERVFEYLPFKIEEINNEDAPIVIKGFDRNNQPYAAPQSFTSYLNDYTPRTKKEEEFNPTGILRYYDNSFWYPEYKNDNTLIHPEEWTPLIKSTMPAHEVEIRFWDKLIADNSLIRLSSELNSNEHRDINKTNIDETYDLYTKAVKKNVLVIDGFVYARSPEPLFAMVNYGSSIKLTTLFSPYDKLGTGEIIDFYSLDKHDDLVNNVEEMRDIYPSNNNQLIITGSSPQLLMPGMFSFKDQEHSLLVAAEKSVRALENSLKEFPLDLIISWHNLKEEVIADHEYSNIDNIGNALSRLSEILISEKEKNPEYIDNKINRATKIANYISRRWETRNIDLDFEIPGM